MEGSRMRTVLAVAVMVLAVASVAIAQEQDDDTNNAETSSQTVVIAGVDRYDTAAKIATQSFSRTHTEVLYIANGETLVDALTVGVTNDRATKMLLVTRDSVPQVTLDALDHFEVCRVVFLGGDDVISPQVRDTIHDNVTSYC